MLTVWECITLTDETFKVETVTINPYLMPSKRFLRNEARRAKKKSKAQSEAIISKSLEEPKEKFTERHKLGKKVRSDCPKRATNDQHGIHAEIEYGASNRYYKGKRCNRSKQYKSEGICSDKEDFKQIKNH